MRLLRLCSILYAVGLLTFITLMLFARQEEVRAQWLAFVSLRDGQFDIYMTNIYSGEIQRITNTPATETNVVWSPNASHLLFTQNAVSEWRVASIHRRSKVESVLLRDRRYISRVSWSGGTIAFDEYIDGEQSDILGLDVRTSQLYPITENDVTEIYPEFTPDGIIYAAILAEGSDGYGLYTTNGDVIIENEYSYLNPSVSPDGQWVVASRFFQRRFELVKINMHTGEEILLDVPHSDPNLPRWSPDGRWVAYVAFANNNFDIFITDGTQIRQVTDHPLWDSSPAWMPVVDLEWHMERLAGGVMLLVGLQVLMAVWRPYENPRLP
ncbi:MAG: hypothetical protein L0154_03785 [Chloroflexi bacterium]|nr:hypothetical protein [Chloroflexota bacterium]